MESDLHKACELGDVQWVEMLISLKADINSKASDGNTPLHIASMNGHAGVVQLLIESGAKISSTSLIDITPLQYACAFGHMVVVKVLVNAGANVNCQDCKGQTPLLCASAVDNMYVVWLLIQSKANVNSARSDGISPLWMASQKGHIALVQLLLRAGADINRPHNSGASPLWIASQNGHIGVVRLLMSAKADINLQQTTDGATALYQACQNIHFELVELLLASGAHTNISRTDGTSPLWIASQHGSTDLVELLLKSGADSNSSHNSGASPLWIASQNGYIGVVRLLLSSKADVNLQQTTTGGTALYMACQNGHFEVVKLLLKSGADSNSTNDDGNSPLWTASQNGHIGVVRLLMSSKAEINSMQATTGVSTLYQACQNGHLEIVQLLLKAGVDCNAACDDGASPMWIACQNGHTGVVRLLLSAKADINSPTNKNGTPALFIACQNGHLELVKLLLASGADCNFPCDDGTSALYAASQNGHLKIVQLLLSSGSYVNLLRFNGDSALHSASRNGHLEIVKLLCDAGANVNADRADKGTTPLAEACNHGHLQVIKFLLTHTEQKYSNNIENSLSCANACCMSLCKFQNLNDAMPMFIFNFLELCVRERSVSKLSDYLTTALDALLIVKMGTNALVGAIIEVLGYAMVDKGRLDKPLYAIMPDTAASEGRLRDDQSLHSTFSALICVLNVTQVKTFLRYIEQRYNQQKVISMCNGLLRLNILHIIALSTNCEDPTAIEKAQLFLDLGVDIWAKDVNGRTPVHIACIRGHIQLAKYYMEAMAASTIPAHLNNLSQYKESVYCRRCHSETKSGSNFKLTECFQQHLICDDAQPNDKIQDNIGKLPIDYCDILYNNEQYMSSFPKSIDKIVHEFDRAQILSQLQKLHFNKVSTKDMEQLLSSTSVSMSGENEIIFTCIFRLVEKICISIGDMDPRFACKPILSGSVYEGTKTFLLDELDFCLAFVNFHLNSLIYVRYEGDELLAVCTLPDISALAGEFWKLTPDAVPLFGSTLFCARFWQLFLQAVTSPLVSEYLLNARITVDDCRRKSGFVGTMSTTWYGETYSNLTISVDIVPIVDLEEYESLIQRRRFDYVKTGPNIATGMELSSTKKDKALMASLTKVQRDAYRLAKVIRGLAKSFKTKSNKILTSDKVIQSYLIKSSLMWIIDPKDQFSKYYKGLDRDEILKQTEWKCFTEVFCAPYSSSASLTYIEQVCLWTVKIFTMLQHLLQSGQKMRPYNLPFSEILIRDKDLAVALCEKCIEIAQPGYQ